MWSAGNRQLEIVMLSEVNQVQKDKSLMFLSYVEDKLKRETYTKNDYIDISICLYIQLLDCLRRRGGGGRGKQNEGAQIILNVASV
jgi:hypothetical protein